MPDYDEFRLRPGRIGRDRSVAGQLKRIVNLARGGARAYRASQAFAGTLARGAGVGRLVGSGDRFAHARARRVVLKTRIVKLGGKGAARSIAHLRYLQRDGTTREGERGALYAADRDVVDGREFLDRCGGDRHQFRFIIAAEDGAEYDDLKPLVRRLMDQAERDLGTRLDWVAVDHFNTGRPHSHILLRGKDEHGADLVIAPEYLTKGLRGRAAELVNLDLGPRTDRDIQAAQTREIGQERFTQIDRRLIAAIDADGLVSPAHRDGIEQAARAGRLQSLSRLGFATEERRGQWRLDADMEASLKAMGRRGDIIATMQHELARRGRGVGTDNYAIHDPAHGTMSPVTGRVVSGGLSDELRDRRYVIVEGLDGLTHHIDVGEVETLPKPDSIVRVSSAEFGPRQADVAIAAVAGRHGGSYSIDAHLADDQSATEDFATGHVRRLEALRRASNVAERAPEGSWIIAPDHLDRVAAHERRQAERRPVTITTLSERPLETLPGHDGSTWLDRELVAAQPAKLAGGFGGEVRRAQQLRQQWLVEQGLADRDGSGGVSYRGNLVAVLQRRELARVGAQLSEELGLGFVQPRHGDEIAGIVRRPVVVGDAKFALIENSHEFSLVPWREVHERALGQHIAGIMRDSGSISWTIGRSRGLGI